jgi:NADH-quinone oxidoreductase subunit G
VLLGNAAVQHPQASQLLALAGWIAAQTGATVGSFGEAANSVGAQLVGALPAPGGLDVGAMLAQSLKAYVLLHVEPQLDLADPLRAARALESAEMVVALTAFKSAAQAHADVMLPIAPFSETAGTFVNAEGRPQSFYGVVKPLGETRPAWKVLRVLGTMLDLPGFGFETAEEVRAQALGDVSALAQRLNNEAVLAGTAAPAAAGFERIADVPIYSTDVLVRRAPALQQTGDARAPMVSVSTSAWSQLSLKDGDRVRVQVGGGVATLPVRCDATLAAQAVRVPAGHPATAELGPLFAPVELSKA